MNTKDQLNSKELLGDYSTGEHVEIFDLDNILSTGNRKVWIAFSIGDPRPGKNFSFW